MKMSILITFIVLIFATSCIIPIKSPKKTGKQEWQKIASFGVITTVYMSPSGLADKFYIAQVLQSLRNQNAIQQIWFFDDKTNTPMVVPITDKQMLHWRAKYGVNRNTGYEEFVFFKVTNPMASPPELRVEEANIRPGYAE